MIPSVFKRRKLNLNLRHPQKATSFSSLPLLHTQQSHSYLLKSGTLPFQSSQLVQSYCNSGAFTLAHQLFDEIPNWDLISATAIITTFAHHNRHSDAVSLFSRTLSSNLKPNEFTFGTTMHSATGLRDPNIGRQIHSSVIKLGFHSNVFVASSLVNHYAKLGTIQEAQLAFHDTPEPNVVTYTALISGYLKNEKFGEALALFRDMPERNVVSWNATIGGCSQVGLNEDSVNLFVEMCREGVLPDKSTFPCVFTAAANIAALGMGKSLHASAIKFLGNKLDVYVGNSLISFYAKCGSLEDSVLAFNKHNGKNIVSWNAVVCGFAQNGRGEEALEFYKKMRDLGLKPNGVTLLGLLFGCNHSGLVDDGYAFFKLAKIEQPEILRAEHYACIVDLLSRAGRFNEARKFLQDLPFEPGIGFWKSLIGGSQIHGKKELAEAVAQCIQILDPKDISSYVLLSNIYSAAGSWDNVSIVRREIKEKGMKRIPGCSWIEIQNKVHVFFSADCSHPQSDEIYTTLEACLHYRKEDTYNLEYLAF
uniref:Pentatricopeptide repeat-containing protein n=1 Tax=Ananas comosus var. bracteatus TaxID=296719 RepID=A0A6V7QXG8_ANACO